MNDKSYINWQSMSDDAIIKLLGEFVKYHRLEQDKPQNKVADKAHMSRSTLSLLEKGENATLATFIQVLRVLDVLPVLDAFLVPQQIQTIDPDGLELKKRKRASHKNKIIY